MKNFKKVPNTILGSAVATAGLAISSAPVADEDVFSVSDLPKGYLLAEADTDSSKMAEGKCGEGKCGGMAGAEEGSKMKEGSCGAGMKMGEGSCGGNMKMGEGSCGGMIMDEKVMVMNANSENLPRDCKEISEDVKFTVRAGVKYATYNGTIFGFDTNEWNVKPCSRVTIKFINEDDVRHQWMMHGLPKYLYPEGMFHLEVNGPGEVEGTFIVASDAKTMLVHCDISQHMQKGMKGQLKVNGGAGDLPSIPGISGSIYPDSYKEMKPIK